DDPVAFGAGYRAAMVVSAVLLALGGLMALIGLRRTGAQLLAEAEAEEQVFELPHCPPASSTRTNQSSRRTQRRGA
ncbi:MAG: hypothetical protein H0V32_12190, partial [Nocardioidaceae bacterium]|nr:hypothetical protein [Nocardioidaceae bacterium]